MREYLENISPLLSEEARQEVNLGVYREMCLAKKGASHDEQTVRLGCLLRKAGMAE
jgi:hypothetical protein